MRHDPPESVILTEFGAVFMRHDPPEFVILSGVWRGFMRQTQPKDLLAAHLTSTSDPFQPAVNVATQQCHRQSPELPLARLHAPPFDLSS
jgi:hypothetical protein